MYATIAGPELKRLLRCGAPAAGMAEGDAGWLTIEIPAWPQAA
jgi:hypothetical protein